MLILFLRILVYLYSWQNLNANQRIRE
uniref:Uncharacterized protein n=1 Tax=Anguilla anguilla TaxID=7936 RepID=A0A0E9R1L5_ANGAN